MHALPLLQGLMVLLAQAASLRNPLAGESIRLPSTACTALQVTPQLPRHIPFSHHSSLLE